MPQPGERDLLELADALAGEAELTSDLLERARPAIPQAVPQLDNRGLARRQRMNHAGELVAQRLLRHQVGGRRRGGVGDDVTKRGLLVFTHRTVEADRTPA